MKDFDSPEDLTIVELSELAERYLATLRSGEVVVGDEYVAMIKVWNTITWDQLEEHDERLAAFHAAFHSDFIPKAATVLGAVPTKGMSLVIKDRGLRIGGEPDASSRYRIVEQP